MHIIIDLIPFVEFSEADKRLYGGILGSIIGAFIGVVLGGLVTLIFTIWNHRKESDTSLRERRLRQYNASHSTLMTMRHELDLILVANRQNALTLKRFSDGTYNENTSTHIFYNNVPKRYPKTSVDSNKLLNSYSSTYWSFLMETLQIQNILLEEFSDNYVTVRDKVRELKLEGRDADEATLIADNEAIIEASAQLINGNDAAYDKILDSYAAVEAFGDFYKKIDKNRFKTGNEFTELNMDMIKYRPSKESFNSHKKQLKAEYDKKLSDEPIKAVVEE